MRWICAAAMLLMATGTPHAAEAEKVTTDPGKPVRVGFYSVLHKDCSGGAVPNIRIKALPTAGTIVIQGGTLTTTRLPNCPKVSAPMRQIIYQPNAGFKGTDEIAFDVVDPADGITVSHTVTITVGSPAFKI